MRKIIFIVFIFIGISSFAQEDVHAYVGDYFQDTATSPVTIIQDSRIQSLVDTHIAINKANGGKISGWRVQIYNSSGSNSRNEAQNERKKFLSKYPGVGAYLIYQPPFFKIRVGDFRTKEEAYSFYKQLLVDFPVSYLITDQINYPKLQSPTPVIAEESLPDEELEGGIR